MPTDETGPGPILRDGLVWRATRPWTTNVHALLEHVKQGGFDAAPRSAGYDENFERVTFIEGESGDLDNLQMRSVTVLTSAARLLRIYHDCSASFQPLAEGIWQLKPQPPFEVICHGDFAPYNVVIHAGKAIGIIDFEAAHPGPRTWDIAYAVYRWAPLSRHIAAERIVTIEEQISRARDFLDTYGLPADQRAALPDLVIARLKGLVAFMEAEAAQGSEKYRRDIEQGHHRLYRDDVGYIRVHRDQIAAGLMAT
ncbi:aminoglycoside phosphotransferase family protein [Rhizobium sullae]|uniref:aminoglycoside phosphotransferase family protein n=1 Tax=Rhizobium sullae TaxID=50338 RepID=UPI000B35167C|nr:aminoglycoside phosphotransferase family protein [Rhizobium sullae]